VRCIGEVKRPKLEVLRSATSIVEDRLGALGSNQYFAAIIENKFADEPSPKASARSLPMLWIYPRRKSGRTPSWTGLLE